MSDNLTINNPSDSETHLFNEIHNSNILETKKENTDFFPEILIKEEIVINNEDDKGETMQQNIDIELEEKILSEDKHDAITNTPVSIHNFNEVQNSNYISSEEMEISDISNDNIDVFPKIKEENIEEINEPVVDEPVVDEPVVDEPVVDEPAVESVIHTEQIVINVEDKKEKEEEVKVKTNKKKKWSFNFIKFIFGKK